MFTIYMACVCVNRTMYLISDRGQNAGSGTTPSATSKERQFSGDGVTDHEIRLKLGGFSGWASRYEILNI